MLYDLVVLTVSTPCGRSTDDVHDIPISRIPTTSYTLCNACWAARHLYWHRRAGSTLADGMVPMQSTPRSSRVACQCSPSRVARKNLWHVCCAQQRRDGSLRTLGSVVLARWRQATVRPARSRVRQRRGRTLRSPMISTWKIHERLSHASRPTRWA